MSWLTTYVRPRIRNLLGKREVPDNLWTQCNACNQMIFAKELERTLKVCPHCGTSHERAGSTSAWPGPSTKARFTRIELPRAPVDPLGFRDQKRYTDRLKENRAKTHLDEALVVAHGTITGTQGGGRRDGVRVPRRHHGCRTG